MADNTKIEKVKAEENIDHKKDYVIVVDEQMGVEGNDDVFVGVNGHTYLIARGKEVVVPGYVADAIEKAIFTKYKYDDNGNVKEYKVPRYPVRRIREATARDKTKNKVKVER
jgi:hypothetical protein